MGRGHLAFFSGPQAEILVDKKPGCRLWVDRQASHDSISRGPLVDNVGWFGEIIPSRFVAAPPTCSGASGNFSSALVGQRGGLRCREEEGCAGELWVPGSLLGFTPPTLHWAEAPSRDPVELD